MSKASKFKDHMDKTRELRPMPLALGPFFCRVDDSGCAMLGNYTVSPDDLILLRDWITENFE